MASKLSDKIRKLVDEAPVARDSVGVNYGRLTVEPVVVTFHGKGVQPTRRTLQEYADEMEMEVDEVELTDSDQLQLRFTIHVQELNPSLSFETVDRDIALLKSGKKSKTDFSETVEPSLIAVFGKDWEDVLLGDNAGDVWVAAEMVDSVRFRKEGEKVYTTMKFIQRFKNRAACEAARDERYGKPETTEVKDDDDEVGEEEGDEDENEFPESVLKQVYTIWKGGKKNDKNTIALIGKSKQLKQYDADELLKAAKEYGNS